MENIKLIVALTALFASSEVSAGKWHAGEGVTIEMATKNAIHSAVDRYKEKGKGCLSGEVSEPVKKKAENQAYYWYIKVYRHGQNGSCGK